MLESTTWSYLKRVPTVLWIVLAWAVLFLPSLDLRALHWEEGRNALRAWDILENGNWLSPRIYGERWVVQPPLLPWLIAVTGWLLGGMSEWAVRLPTMIAVLFGAVMIARITECTAGRAASLLAAGCWLLSPQMLQRGRLGEPDIIMAVLSFSAFIIWWSGWKSGRVSWGRWLACGMLLTIVAAAKGPQPTAFFGLGVLGFLLLKGAWQEFPGYLVTMTIPIVAVLFWKIEVFKPGDEIIWLQFMRLRVENMTFSAYIGPQAWFLGSTALQLLPGLLLALPFWWSVVPYQEGSDNDFAVALLLYGGLCTCLLIFWPGANTRYLLPASPAIAIAAGLAFNKVLWRRIVMLRMTIFLLCAFASFQLLMVWVVMPIKSEWFATHRSQGEAITALVAGDPAPVFLTPDAAWGMHNVAFYIHPQPVQLTPTEILKQPGGAWVIAAQGEITKLGKVHPQFNLPINMDLKTPPVELARIR